MDDQNFALLLGYSIGSLVTGLLVWKSASMKAIEKTIDNLIENGYLKTRQGKNELEIIPFHEE